MNPRKIFASWGTAVGLTTALCFGTVARAQEKMIPHASITFDAGSSFLTDADKTTLRRLVEEERAKGNVYDVTVAAWSDKKLPAMGKKLPDFDRELAANRADAIRDYLKTVMSVPVVETYNMAESANWLARTFNTKDSELKSMFGRTGAMAPLNKEEFRCIKAEGGPSTAVAVIEQSRAGPDVVAPPAP
jgi:hypothetical protein